jgi:hypothetical protein
MHVGMASFFQNPGKRLADAEVYRQEIAIADLAEPLGFDSIWSAEHHFDDYTMCPNVAQFLTYMAGRTRRAGLGSMVMVLPWHDPVRLAEEISVLDTLSDGRLILGVGRGLGRIEFQGFRGEMGESRSASSNTPRRCSARSKPACSNMTASSTNSRGWRSGRSRRGRSAVAPMPRRSRRNRWI